MEKIAVQCQTLDEWYKVKDKVNMKYPNWNPSMKCWGSSEICITEHYLDETPGFSEKERFKGRDYTIISASEYLNEGGKDVKKCDNKECNRYDEEEDGNFCDVLCNVTECAYWGGSKKDFWETVKPTTQTTKENNMNVNSTIAKVFKDVDDAILVTKYLGKEYEEGNHRAYLDLKANDKLVLAEAERLEKEEKDK